MAVLEYALEQAPREERIAQQCVRDKLPLPKAILNAPQLLLGLELYWEAYTDLSTCRPAGFNSVMPIPWTAYREWAQENELDSEQLDKLASFGRKMDIAFLSWHERKNSSG